MRSENLCRTMEHVEHQRRVFTDRRLFVDDIFVLQEFITFLPHTCTVKIYNKSVTSYYYVSYFSFLYIKLSVRLCKWKIMDHQELDGSVGWDGCGTCRTRMHKSSVRRLWHIWYVPQPSHAGCTRQSHRVPDDRSQNLPEYSNVCSNSKWQSISRNRKVMRYQYLR